MTFTKSTVQIGHSVATVFNCVATNDKFYSLTSVAYLIGKPALSPFQFLASKAFKASHSNGYNPFHFSTPDGATHKLLSCEVASEYLMYHAFKGDPKAQEVVKALAQESLELRAKSAFSPVTDEVYQEVKTGNDKALQVWENARKVTMSTHQDFQNACLAKKHSAPQVHDLITKKICGFTASEHRLLELVKPESDKTIGLNHQVSAEMLLQVATAKRLYKGYKKGSWRDQVLRAVYHACPE